MRLKSIRDAPLARLLAAMAVGAFVGAFAPACVIRALNSFGSTFAQFIKFIVPFIIVGLVTPAIAEAGRSAGRMLLATIAIAYASTIISGAFAFSVADAVLPRIVSGSLAASGAAKAFPAFFTLKIPPVMDVVTAIAVAFVFGLAMATVECPALTRAFGEIKRVISLAIAKAVVPLLPFYILTVVADLTARGSLAQVCGPSVKIIMTAVAATWLVLVVQYAIAGIVARRNPLKALWTMLPAYFTGLGCCSSAATIPVTLRQVKANGVSEETANLVVPLCANVHLAGSIAKIVVFSAGFLLLSGGTIGAGAFAEYILLLSVLAVAAPGVPGGMVLAAAPIAESALGLAPEHYAILMAAYLSIDGVGTSCNLTGDGAIALVVDKFRRCNA
ncbi:MAG: cation:dicarboxylase symporter family transporter [Kiritimatiellae bacterium]|nr:cation:dicarboxylase symporter family transporter [Kiritimatiellia bacterium]